MSQCYAGSRLLHFSLELNSRKSLFGPLVNLGMPKRPISLLLAQGLSVFQLASFPCCFSPASHSHCCFEDFLFLNWNVKFGVHLVILHVHQQVLLPQMSVSVLRLLRDCAHKLSRRVMLSAGARSIQLGFKAAAESSSKEWS